MTGALRANAWLEHCSTICVVSALRGTTTYRGCKLNRTQTGKLKRENELFNKYVHIYIYVYMYKHYISLYIYMYICREIH